MKEIAQKVVLSFSTRYDDRNERMPDNESVSLRKVAENCGITMLKARKILITEGMYSTVVSREVQKLLDEGKSIPEIVKSTGLSRASVHSYIPYKKGIYKLSERSADADRMNRARERKRLCSDFVRKLPELKEKETERFLWNIIEELQGCWFRHKDGRKYRYVINDGKIIFDGKVDSGIRKKKVMEFFWEYLDSKQPRESDGDALQVSGSELDYLEPVFTRITADDSGEKEN